MHYFFGIGEPFQIEMKVEDCGVILCNTAFLLPQPYCLILYATVTLFTVFHAIDENGV